MGRLDYSAGVAYFNAKRKNPRTFPGDANDKQALGYFRNAMAYPSTQRDAQHAAGLCHYYSGNRDSATVYLKTLDQYGYFDTLKLFPNLKTLLGIQETALLDFRLRRVGDLDGPLVKQLGRNLRDVLDCLPARRAAAPSLEAPR